MNDGTLLDYLEILKINPAHRICRKICFKSFKSNILTLIENFFFNVQTVGCFALISTLTVGPIVKSVLLIELLFH